MQANNIDNASENSQEENVCGNGNLNAAAHELNQIRADALRRIDEGGFSCVAGLSLSLFTPVHHHGVLQLVSF
jgi:hypothetical protein